MDVIPATLMSLLPEPLDVNLCSDFSNQQASLIALKQSLFKKLEPKGNNRNADKAALLLFRENNARCSHWEPDQTSYYYDILLYARQRLHERFFGGELQEPRVSLRKCLERLKPGPGSSRGTKLTDFVGKVFCSRLTTYDQALWKYYRENIPTVWKAAENLRSQQYGEYSVVTASKLSFAKKNSDISRVINTEASLEMLFQLSLGEQIEEWLKDDYNICLSSQPTINRFLAWLGSLYGSHGTIDLKSASDLISTAFMRWYLPAPLFRALDTVRAKCIELPSGEVLELNMFSTMGNGFTFPLQTLVFASITEAVYECARIPAYNHGQVPAFSVFGDDIICVSDAFDQVTKALEFAGHTVNRTKSFNSGLFRESCGSDFFRGHNIRGVYVKKLYHETHFYSLFNRLTRWSIRNGVDLSPVLRYLKGLVDFRPVPFDAQDGAGIKLPLHLSGLRTKASITKYRALVNKPIRCSTKNYERNPVALYLAALGGYIEGDRRRNNTVGMSASKRDKYLKKLSAKGAWTGSFTPRDRPDGPPRVKEKELSSSSWDWIPQKGLTTLDYDMIFYAIA